MRIGREITVFIGMFGVLVGACHWNPARAQPRQDMGTRELLEVLLTTPAADQPIFEQGPCSKANNATSVRGDVIFFLSKLSTGSDAIACRLIIGQNIDRTENVWTRTYTLLLDKLDHRPKEPIECYTIP